LIAELTLNALGVAQEAPGGERPNGKSAGPLLALVYIKAPQNCQKIGRILRDLVREPKLSRRQINAAAARSQSLHQR